jgi:glutaredoxin
MEFLSRRSIPHEGRDIAEKQEYLDELVATGFMATPVTIIGEESVVGYDPNTLNKALRAQGFAGG